MSETIAFSVTCTTQLDSETMDYQMLDRDRTRDTARTVASRLNDDYRSTAGRYT